MNTRDLRVGRCCFVLICNGMQMVSEKVEGRRSESSESVQGAYFGGFPAQPDRDHCWQIRQMYRYWHDRHQTNPGKKTVTSHFNKLSQLFIDQRYPFIDLLLKQSQNHSSISIATPWQSCRRTLLHQVVKSQGRLSQVVKLTNRAVHHEMKSNNWTRQRRTI